MKPTLYWKYADLAGQFFMLLPLIYIVSPGRREYALICYALIGLWPILSCVITSWYNLRPAGPGRKLYGLTMGWLIGIFCLCTILFWDIHAYDPANDSIVSYILTLCEGRMQFEATALRFIIPLMAIWYIAITIDEIITLRSALHHRSEIHWKL